MLFAFTARERQSLHHGYGDRKHGNGIFRSPSCVASRTPSKMPCNQSRGGSPFPRLDGRTRCMNAPTMYLTSSLSFRQGSKLPHRTTPSEHGSIDHRGMAPITRSRRYAIALCSLPLSLSPCLGLPRLASHDLS